MIKTFLEGKSTYSIKSKFGNFLYDIDTSRDLPKENFFTHTLAKEALLHIYKKFEKNNLKFFLIFGTCLGAVRDRNFIKHDIDIDLGIYYKDKHKLIESISILLNEYEFKVLKISSEEESITVVYKNIIIDIGLFSKKKNYYIYNNFYENKMPQNFLDQLDTINFLGENFYIPSQVESYLKYQYGKNWKTPVPEWDYYNKYISTDMLQFLRRTKLNVKKYLKKVKEIRYKILMKSGLLHKNILNELNIKNIKSVQKSGQGFCDTYVIKANKSIVLKINNQSRFEYFKKDFEKIEPIYQFINYKERFLHEKQLFERLNCEKVKTIDNVIVFPFIDSKPLSNYIESVKFYDYLQKAIEVLKTKKVSHGDFHIDNILITKDSKIVVIDFEMIFSDYLSKTECFYYDIYYFFAKLEYQYPNYFDENYQKLKYFIDTNFTLEEKNNILKVAEKTKKYFFSVNGARVELFK